MHTFPKGIRTMWNANSLVQVWTRIPVSISYDDNCYTTNTLFATLKTYKWDSEVGTWYKDEKDLCVCVCVCVQDWSLCKNTQKIKNIYFMWTWSIETSVKALHGENEQILTDGQKCTLSS